MNAAHLQGLVVAKINELRASKDSAEDFFKQPVEGINTWMTWPETIPVSAVERVFDFSKLPAFSRTQEAIQGGQKVLITLPFYKSTHPATAFSIIGLVDRAKVRVMLRYGDAFIVHTRNVLAEDFLRGEIEWQLTIDDDMIVPFGNGVWLNAFCGYNLPERFASFHTVDRLLSHGKSLVGALYFGRWRHGKPVYCEGSDDPKEAAYARKGPYDICKPTKWVGTGCMLIHRSVYLDVELAFPHLARNPDTGRDGNWFSPDSVDVRKSYDEAMAVLNDTRINERARIAKAAEILDSGKRVAAHQPIGVGEDVTFCKRAARSGHVAHVDMGLVCGHIGSVTYGPNNTLG